jgi:glycine dehydrogenase subunit 1
MITAVAEAMSLGVLKGPGELGADIVACDTQSFGMDLSFGGPHNACLAARRDYVRQLPGRIVGETKDVDGKRVFVMTLRAREQDIRRARATSNICSNHGLNATANNIYLSLLGTEGLYRVSSLNTRAAHYLESLLLRSGNYEKVFDCPFYNEFVLKSREPLPDIKARLLEGGFLPPLELGTLFDKAEMRDAFLFAVTEVLTRADLDRIGSILSR